MTTVGVLCARGRVEEKALMAALAEAGIVSALFPPADEPLPVGPLPVAPCGRAFPTPRIVVDRHQDRQIARAVLATCRGLGVPTISAGIAATGDRLDVAAALAAHGLPRPRTALATSEAAALQAVGAMGLPATLLPLDLKAGAIELRDIDAAEALLEHRAVLGGSEGSLSLLQSGSPAPHDMITIIVIDGRATAVTKSPDSHVTDSALRLAEESARVLRADLIGVEIAARDGAPLVWDARPAPDFRRAIPLGSLSVAEAIARSVERRLAELAVPPHPSTPEPGWSDLVNQGMARDLVISA